MTEYGLVGGKTSRNGYIYSYGILVLEMFTGKKPTDEIFTENLSLHQFAKMASPERVMEIVDPCLRNIEHLSKIQEHANIRGTLAKCLVSIFKIGVSCSLRHL